VSPSGTRACYRCRTDQRRGPYDAVVGRSGRRRRRLDGGRSGADERPAGDTSGARKLNPANVATILRAALSDGRAGASTGRPSDRSRAQRLVGSRPSRMKRREVRVKPTARGHVSRHTADVVTA
jgi:hypothetical protein